MITMANVAHVVGALSRIGRKVFSGPRDPPPPVCALPHRLGRASE